MVYWWLTLKSKLLSKLFYNSNSSASDRLKATLLRDSYILICKVLGKTADFKSLELELENTYKELDTHRVYKWIIVATPGLFIILAIFTFMTDEFAKNFSGKSIGGKIFVCLLYIAICVAVAVFTAPLVFSLLVILLLLVGLLIDLLMAWILDRPSLERLIKILALLLLLFGFHFDLLAS